MIVESIPSFTDPAAKLWAKIPPDTKKLLLSNVWCGKYRDKAQRWIRLSLAGIEAPSKLAQILKEKNV